MRRWLGLCLVPALLAAVGCHCCEGFTTGICDCAPIGYNDPYGLCKHGAIVVSEEPVPHIMPPAEALPPPVTPHGVPPGKAVEPMTKVSDQEEAEVKE